MHPRPGDNEEEQDMTNNDNKVRSISKFLSFVLRREPQSIGLTLDEAGWADVDDLLARAAGAGKRLDRALLQHVVDTNDKRRFALSEDGARIQANQGHSIEIELGLPAATPPDVLYHGTATRFLDSILATGLDKRQRHHVHLTESITTATAVGQRYGKLVLLAVDSRRMRAEGHVFHCSDNGVWLTDAVAPHYLRAMP
jgi:putative RNA 2'-phosphotransferase